MKKTLLLVLISYFAIELTACTKTYSCKCTNNTTLSQEWEDLSNKEAENAEKACAENHKIALFSNDSCSFVQE